MSSVYSIFSYRTETGMPVKIRLFKRLKDDRVQKVHAYSTETCLLPKKFPIFSTCALRDLQVFPFIFQKLFADKNYFWSLNGVFFLSLKELWNFIERCTENYWLTSKQLYFSQ